MVQKWPLHVQKGANKFLPVALPTADRFLDFFHCRTRK